MSMKSMAMFAGVVLALVLVVLGPAAVISHIRAGGEVARETLERMSPNVQEAARIRVLLRDMDKQINVYEEKLIDVEEKRESAEKRTLSAQRELAYQKKILGRAQVMLTSTQPRFDIGGKAYTSDELRMDTRSRLHRCQELERQVAFQTTVANQLLSAEREGKANLGKARSERQQRAAELDQLEMRLAHAGLLQQVNELTEGLADRPLGPETELGRAMANFRSRVRAAERRSDQSLVAAKEGMVVDWDGRGRETEDVRQALAEYLGAVPAVASRD